MFDTPALFGLSSAWHSPFIKRLLLSPASTHLAMKLVLIIAFLVMSLTAYAQCTQKISDLPAAPELYGFHLGMTKEQVTTLVPQTHFGKTDHFGVAKTTINPGFDSK